MSTHSPRRPTHRSKRLSLALKLSSSDTTNSLPQYIATCNDEPPSDQPPDYPDSAEEADKDTDSSSDSSSSPRLFLPTPVSPRRHAAFAHQQHRRVPLQNTHHHHHHHRRKYSSTSLTDPYLDSLLARSVHALEMSNTLLQSSISTQTSLSHVFAASGATEFSVDTSDSITGLEVNNSRSRSYKGILKDKGASKQQDKWADQLDEISRGVDRLFEDDNDVTSPTSSLSFSPPAISVSCSLPTASSPLKMYAQRRRPSMLELRSPSEHSNQPSLQLSYQDRSNLVAPPPRALTQYVSTSSSGDTETISLPSTIGIRAPPSMHSYASQSHSHLGTHPAFSSSSLSLHAALSEPQLTDKPIEPSTPAYNMLSSFMHQHRGPAVSSPSSSPFGSLKPNGASAGGAPATVGTHSSSSSSTVSTSVFLPAFFTASASARHNSRLNTPPSNPSSRRTSPSTTRTTSPITFTSKKKSPSPSPTVRSTSRSPHSLTPKQTFITSLPPSTSASQHRPMTPPTEEELSFPSSSSSTEESSSDDSCPAKRTVQSLRKILDEQPPPPSPPTDVMKRKPPAFLPRTPAVAPASGTSTATASITRLFTRGKHTSSTRPPSPPRQSAMKRSASSSALALSSSSPNGSGSGIGTPNLSQGVTPASTAPQTPDVLSPSPSPTVLAIPELLNLRRSGSGTSAAGGGGVDMNSVSSSGYSTPTTRARKRISFAELPESYAKTNNGGGSMRRRGRRKSKMDGGMGRKGDDADDGSDDGGRSWWGWLGVGSALSNGTGNGYEYSGMRSSQERLEDRLSRSWGGRMAGSASAAFGGGMDEWTV